MAICTRHLSAISCAVAKQMKLICRVLNMCPATNLQLIFCISTTVVLDSRWSFIWLMSNSSTKAETLVDVFVLSIPVCI